MSQDTRIEDRDVEASRRLAEVLDPSVIDALLADAAAVGTPIDGVDELLNRMTKAVIERALAAEMTLEVGYERGIRPVRTRATLATAIRLRRSRRRTGR